MTILVDFLYLIAMVLAGPVFLLRRALFVRKKLAPMGQRLGGFPRQPKGARTVWIHGVSVGEVLAARGLVAGLEGDASGTQVVISTTTPAGFETAQKCFPGRPVFHAPLDLSFAVRRAFDALNPRLLVLMELELWPNLLAIAAERGVPVVVANAKMSERSLRGYRRLLRFLPHFLDPVRAFGAQGVEHAARIRALGVPEDRIRVTGSVKVDNLPKAPMVDAGREFRELLGLGEDPVLLAGSLHPGEDEPLLEAYGELLRREPRLRLVLAPRHLERIEGLERLARAHGHAVLRRSSLPAAGQASSRALILVDTMGELARLFVAADLVFLGGSLVPVGGHNLFEPAAQGKPVLFGPYVHTVKEAALELIAAGGGFQVTGKGDIIRHSAALLGDPSALAAAGRAARSIVDRHRGATERTIALLREVMVELKFGAGAPLSIGVENV